MAKIDISVPKGTRDFDPLQMGRRNYIFSTLRSIFEKHGFQPIETPSMEQTSTLLGKYGEEGDRLIFRILNSGDFMSNIPAETEKKSSDIVNFISEKGLRYDLTVPFARFVVMNRNNITFPFRRYQIQPVWRADRPQKGRYREFYQCDVDVIGTKSQMEEAGLIEILDTAFDKFGINIIIKLNNRKLLQGIAIAVGAEDRFIEFTTALDKLDKTGWDGVIKELETIGFQKSVSEKLSEIMSLSGDNNSVISNLKKHIDSEIGKQGIQEMEELFDYISVLNLKSEVKFDISLARGLNYYTGAIFEVVAKDVEMGSISGGGRYDNLTGVFGLPDTSGVGVSFGADRIYDVMLTLNLFPANLNRSADLLLINFDKTSEKDLIPIAKQLRKNGIACVIYPEAAKLKKQFSYADAYNFPYVLIRGDEEKKEGLVNIKNMINGKQVQIKIEELLNCTLQKIEELTK
ncbi:MAG: histidine--tRNA ligase [Bacteroidales bacterium]|nr:histidine--tRNA ligase [Bacteroidales bacterium]